MFGKELAEKRDEWLALRKAEGLRDTTLKAYRDHIHIFLLGLGDNELLPLAFARFFRDYAKEHSSASCRTIFTTMKVFLRGIDRADLMGNMKRPRADTVPKTIYTDGQLATLFTLLRADTTPTGYRDHAAIALLRYGGLRASEMCNLRVDDLLELEDAIFITGGKSRHAQRKIPLIPPCPRILSAYVARGRPALLHGYSTHVFVTVDGLPFTRNTLRQLLRRRGEQVGFPLGAHRFRHTWATVHVKARTNPAIIGQLAGWSPKTLAEMMATYAHPDIEDLRTAQRDAFGH